MGTLREVQAREEVARDLGEDAAGEAIEGPGMLGLWISSVNRWYVLEDSGRRWWTNDPQLIRGGQSFSYDTGEEVEDDQ